VNNRVNDARLANLAKGREKLRLEREQKRIQAQLQTFTSPQAPSPSLPNVKPILEVSSSTPPTTTNSKPPRTKQPAFDVVTLLPTTNGEATSHEKESVGGAGIQSTIKDGVYSFAGHVGLAFVLALVVNSIRYVMLPRDESDTSNPPKGHEVSDSGRYNGISIFK